MWVVVKLGQRVEVGCGYVRCSVDQVLLVYVVVNLALVDGNLLLPVVALGACLAMVVPHDCLSRLASV